ncbi:MAG: hypothetical protein HOC77_10660 [Chloroflexi bacterium]|jgi:hypothetical protein|nr:hypothetical protein [Chloroflexota bacterium]MBT4073925.1 hypothetical protein [Chloroflexota bacterium]MBT4515538.1 hypothetical protein [Chloroflexota bacterium]MBT6681268.1 hypothetical protein [Chloroflexota bacterium]
MARPRFLTFVIPGVLPLIIAAIALASGAPLLTTLAVVTIASVMTFGVYFSERIATPAVLVHGAEAFSRTARAIGIALTRRVRYRGQLAVVKIVSQSGACPLGLEAGATWEISESGRLDGPICRPAALAMGLVLEDVDIQALKACVCPRGPQTVSFAVEST